MAVVTRLVTVVDLHDHVLPASSEALGPDPHVVVSGWAPAPATRGSRALDPQVMSLSALLVAVLGDGRRLTVLDGRGWTASGPPDIWRRTSVEEISAHARTVVGPDEPFGSHSAETMARDHWEHLADALAQHGVHVAAEELRRVPHDVELTERLHTRLGR